MDKELYELLKKCYENNIIFYWGRDGGCTELVDICFNFNEDDPSKLEDFLRDNCNYNLEVCMPPHRRKSGGVVRADTGISERAFHSIFDKVLDDVASEYANRPRYRYLLVPIIDWVKGEDVNPIEDGNVIKILESGYAIKHTNTHNDSRGVLSMSIIFELSGKTTPADALLAFGDKTPWGSDA